ncbi:MAG: hypothetical protein LBT53_04500, partial [Puniceicoccales bacterium]|nr:hypothetical protein [Puniceicoccales bacterium]
MPRRRFRSIFYPPQKKHLLTTSKQTSYKFIGRNFMLYLDNSSIILKTAVESGRLAEAVMASALRGFVRRTNRCAFTNPQSAS